MTYRTKRRLLSFSYYLTSVLGLSYIYIEAAHRNLLPAVFEYYTGDWVRRQTAGFYYATDPQVAKQSGHQASINPSAYNLLDILTREPGYLAAMNLLEHNLQVWDYLPRNINRKELLLTLTSDSTLLLWLKNPKSRFADIYQYEFLSRMDNYRYIEGFRITDEKQHELYRSRSFDAATSPAPAATMQLLKKGFSVPVVQEGRIIGYLQGNWDAAWFPDVPSSSSQQTGFLSLTLSRSGFILQASSEPEGITKYVTLVDNRPKYTGPLTGRRDGQRFVSASVDGITLLVVYPAATWSYYLFQVLLYLAAAAVAILSYFTIRKLALQFKEQPVLRRSKWLQEDLKTSYSLQHQSLELLNQSVRHLQDSRQREGDTLAFLAGRLEEIARRAAGVTPAIVPPQAEQKNPVNSLAAAEARTVTLMTAEPGSLPQEEPNTNYVAAPLPEPEILPPDGDDSIEVIDEIVPQPKVLTLSKETQPEDKILGNAVQETKANNITTVTEEKDSGQETYAEDIDSLFEEILSDITEELDEENFDELLGALSAEGALPLQAPEELPVTASRNIVDEEPQFTKQKIRPESGNRLLTFQENLEQKNWELSTQETTEELREDEDFEILAVSGNIPEVHSEPKRPVAEPPPPAATQDELVLFEDDDLDDLLSEKENRLAGKERTVGSVPVKGTAEQGMPVVSGSFHYQVAPKILPLTNKDKPLELYEKLDPEKTNLVLSEDVPKKNQKTT